MVRIGGVNPISEGYPLEDTSQSRHVSCNSLHALDYPLKMIY